MRWRYTVSLGWICLTALIALAGCNSSDGGGTRTLNITTVPPDALLSIDGADRGKGPVTETFGFTGHAPKHQISASRFGYEPQNVTVDASFPDSNVNVVLAPKSRVFNFFVQPVPAYLSVDGKPLSNEPVTQITTRLEFRLDPSDKWLPHTISAERQGYAKADRQVRYEDTDPNYILLLEAARKNLRIVTDPPGAAVFVESEPVGLSPIIHENFVVPLDPKTQHWIPQTVRAVKPGYEPAETSISWDAGKTEYHLTLSPRSKPVKIVTRPAGATVMLDGMELKRDASGASVGKLAFPPVDEKGETLKTYSATVSKKEEGSEWESATFQLGWDAGREEYAVTLREIRTQPVELIRPRFTRTPQGWTIEPERVLSSAAKSIAEPSGPAPALVVRAPVGSVIGSLATSPDGSQVVYTLLNVDARGALKSRVYLAGTEGTDIPRPMTDDAGVNLTPAFSPDGNQILFASNRNAAPRLALWSAPVSAQPGGAGAKQLTPGDALDLWPSLDSSPRARLFFERRADADAEARLFAAPLRGGDDGPRDLHQAGQKPRVSPQFDRVLFVSAEPKSGRRGLMLMPDAGGAPTGIARAPEYDNMDGAWSKDGGRVAFASDRPTSGPRPAGDWNIWLLDLLHAGASPVQITFNESVDDSPAWDAAGTTLYFRSNRGGTWGIWKIAIK